MAKLNKQEKEYMVRRICDEVEKALEPLPKLSSSLNDAVKKSANDWTLTLKSYEELIENITDVIAKSGNWSPSVPLDLLINVPDDYTAEQEALNRAMELRSSKRDRLMAKAQPLIDSVNLGDSGSSDLSAFIDSIRACD